MLQRIQSLFLFLAALCLAGVLVFPIWSSTTAETSVWVSAFQMKVTTGVSSQITPIYYIALMAFLAGMIAIFTIFQYRNRPKQMLFVALNALLIGILLITMVFMVLKKATPLVPGQKGTFDVGFYLVFGAIVLNQVAGIFIRKDEKMVKDSDRMR